MAERGIQGAGSGIFFCLGVSRCVVEVVAQGFVSLVFFGGFFGGFDGFWGFFAVFGGFLVVF